jgi:hypothetical protein
MLNYRLSTNTKLEKKLSAILILLKEQDELDINFFENDIDLPNNIIYISDIKDTNELINSLNLNYIPIIDETEIDFLSFNNKILKDKKV